METHNIHNLAAHRPFYPTGDVLVGVKATMAVTIHVVGGPSEATRDFPAGTDGYTHVWSTPGVPLLGRPVELLVPQGCKCVYTTRARDTSATLVVDFGGTATDLRPVEFGELVKNLNSIKEGLDVAKASVLAQSKLLDDAKSAAHALECRMWVESESICALCVSRGGHVRPDDSGDAWACIRCGLSTGVVAGDDAAW